MILFPNCKINLGLRILNKRPDGFHNLETIFCPIPLKDAAEITSFPGKKEQAEGFELVITGSAIPGEPSGNLCTRAWQLIKHDFPHIPPVRMHLHKAIPIGAGLGGGSSDGAFTLMLLNKEFRLNLSKDKLIEYAIKLGSDCPFFIVNKPCHATGRGEILQEINVPLDDYYFVLVQPDIHVKTGWAFAELTSSIGHPLPNHAATNNPSLTEIIQQPVNTWKDMLINDFEIPVFKLHPLLKDIKQILYEAGAEYASMTGTGSSIYGIFSKNKKAANLRSDENYKVYILNHSH